MADFDNFLQDHAAAEKKASGMALSMALHYRDKHRLVAEMIELSIEELAHFRECVKLLHQRGLQLEADKKDAYVNRLRAQIRKPSEDCLLDRLLIAGIIEARGVERFALVAQALPQSSLKKFYILISQSEEKHTALFQHLAADYFATSEINSRLDYLLDVEADIVASLPITSCLH